MVDRRPLPVVPAGAPRAAPVFEKVGIVGLGLIGGSIALAARAAWPNALVIGVDGSEVLEQAMALQAVDVGADDAVVLSEADLVILAALGGQNLEMLNVVADHVGGAAVVSDVGSTKRAIVEAARALLRRLRFVGGHPLAGAAGQGIGHARADLFKGRPWLLTPDGDAQGEALLRLGAFIEALGAAPRTLDAEEHDSLMASLRQKSGPGAGLYELFESANDWREILTSALDAVPAKRET